MSSDNGWLGKVKSRVKSAQETAKNRLEKFSETVEKTIKEAQEDLEKYSFWFNFYLNCSFLFFLRQRAAQASAPVAPKVQRWRPSAENPDGEIIAEVKPPPIGQFLFYSNKYKWLIPLEQPVVQSPAETPPEPTPTPVVEPIIILRKRRPGKKIRT